MKENFEKKNKATRKSNFVNIDFEIKMEDKIEL